MSAAPDALPAIPANVATLHPRGPVIEVRAGEVPAMAERAMRALQDAGAGIFQRGGLLVRVAQLTEAVKMDGITRPAGSVVVVPVNRDYMLLALARCADWQIYDGRMKEMRRVNPPAGVAAALLAMAGEWTFPELAGVIAAPTIRTDGSLLDAPGFDGASGLFLASDCDFSGINQSPTMDDARAALELLRDLFSEFVFLEPKHEAAALSALISAGVRQALGIAPGYGFCAFAQSSGKTTLAQAIAHIWLGRDVPATPLGDDEPEVRKAILAALIAGDSILLLDNIERPVSSATLCAVLTSDRFSDRVLGLSQRVTLSTACTWLATGNNLQFQGDLTSRIIMATLDPQMERPESRTFRRDIPAFIAEHRAKLVRACLTIPLAYQAAGNPAVADLASRFRGWDRFVRRPLLWLGVADPVATQDDLRTGDDERGNLVAVLTEWRTAFGTEPGAVAEAVAKACACAGSRPQMLEALQAVADDRKGGINTRVLGRYLARHLRRIESGLRFEDAKADPVTHRRRFRVYGVTGVSGVSANEHEKKCSAINPSSAGENADNASNAVKTCIRCRDEGCIWCQS